MGEAIQIKTLCWAPMAKIMACHGNYCHGMSSTFEVTAAALR